jgi:hypothetical protein
MSPTAKRFRRPVWSVGVAVCVARFLDLATQTTIRISSSLCLTFYVSITYIDGTYSHTQLGHGGGVMINRRFSAEDEAFFRSMMFPEEDRRRRTRQPWDGGFRRRT